jgi:hypothetical protein
MKKVSMNSGDFVDLPFHQRGHQITRDATTPVMLYDNRIPIFLDSPMRCAICGGRVKPTVDDGVVTADTECQAPNGLTTTITLEVPSGRILVTDDLRPIFEIDDTGFESYNTIFGQAQHVKAMAEIGCAYGPVGNSSPTLYDTGNGTYAIATLEWNESDDVNDEEEWVIPEGWIPLANIVTDLWAYSIADFENWKSKGGDPDALMWCDTIVEIPPGVYEFTLHSGESDFNHNGASIYTHIRKIQDL